MLKHNWYCTKRCSDFSQQTEGNTFEIQVGEISFAGLLNTLFIACNVVNFIITSAKVIVFLVGLVCLIVSYIIQKVMNRLR